MRTAKITILDEVNILIGGVNPDTTKKIRDHLTHYVTGYRFMPKYKMGWWDGTICLMTESGKTRLGHLPDILPILEKAGYGVNLVDKRKDWSHIAEQITLVDENVHEGLFWAKNGKPVVLRDYQVEAVNTSLQAGGGIMELATAGGKSITCATIAKKYAPFGYVVVIVPTIQLALQTRSTFRDAGIDAGIWYGGEHDRKQVTLSTWQSLDHYEELMEGVVCVIVDECQGVSGKTLDSILSGSGKNVPFRYGCTGSLPESVLFQKQIKSVLGPVMFELPAWKLQKRGVLAQSIIHQIEIDDKSQKEWKYYTRTNDERTWDDDLKWMMGNEERVRVIADMIQIISQTGPSLVLVSRKEFGKTLERSIPGSIYMDGDVNAKIRDEVFREFNGYEQGTLICTDGIAAVGIDIPLLANVIPIELGKQFVKIMQVIGRGLRKEGEKTHVEIWDFHSNDGFSASHAKERQRLYRKAKQQYDETKIGY